MPCFLRRSPLHSYHCHPLITPHVLYYLHLDEVLVFITGCNPVLFRNGCIVGRCYETFPTIANQKRVSIITQAMMIARATSRLLQVPKTIEGRKLSSFPFPSDTVSKVAFSRFLGGLHTRVMNGRVRKILSSTQKKL